MLLITLFINKHTCGIIKNNTRINMEKESFTLRSHSGYSSRSCDATLFTYSLTILVVPALALGLPHLVWFTLGGADILVCVHQADVTVVKLWKISIFIYIVQEAAAYTNLLWHHQAEWTNWWIAVIVHR